MARRVLRIVGGVVFLSALALPPLLLEMALHLPAERKTRVPDSEAAAIARLSGGSWRLASVAGARGAAMQGWWFEPSRPVGKTVLLLHGLGDSRRGMLGFTRWFLAEGYHVLVTDNRNHGTSGGDAVTYGLLEREDVARWLDWAGREQPGAALFALGESMGASILIQALERETRLRAVVAECAFATFRDAALERIPRITGLPRAAGAPIFAAAMLYGRARYGFDLETVSPLDSMRRIRTPVLLIHGLDDEKTAAAQSRRLHEANRAVSELWEVPGARHVQASVVAEAEFKRRVLDWFSR